MTSPYRVCGLGVVEPSIVLFGQRYGVCTLARECPRGTLCGYIRTRRIIEEDNKREPSCVRSS